MEFTHLIDGRSEASETSFDVINPATGKVFAASPDASKAQLDTAVAAARRAFVGWRALAFGERPDYDCCGPYHPGALHGQHGDSKTFTLHPAYNIEDGRDRPRYFSTRRFEHPCRRRRPGPLDDGASGHRQDFVYGVRRDWQES